MSDQEAHEENEASVRQICTLLFSDGQTVSGEIVATSRFDDCSVNYTGAVERLPFRFNTADSILLRAFFESFSRELKAKFREETIGVWPSSEPLDDGQHLEATEVESTNLQRLSDEDDGQSAIG